MSRERIKDSHGRTIGMVDTDGHGKTILRDNHNRLLGTEKDGHVKDSHASTVCYGTGSLFSLLKGK